MTSLTCCHERLDELGNTMASTNTRLASVEQQQADIHPLKEAEHIKNFTYFTIALKRMAFDLDVIVLTECRIAESSIIPVLPGYISYRTHKITNQNSGVVVYIKDAWNSNVTEPVFNEADCLIIEIPHC
ncbi:unnamed protein product [Parnassius apollo]|uniref:(apollo) hypothetical protein n=1 Tax=Parnassius apollo TaxID=110799 RepID=A0A8S3WQD6_PARAO|nr:unnamed protein product [Parnassius apollo]